MKKIKYILLFIITFFFTFTSVNAASITNTDYINDCVKIEGTGSGQIQIVLFDFDNNPIYMTTTMANNNKFSITLPKIEGLKSGTYKVKTADYDGSNVDNSVVKIGNKSIDENNPNTLDNIVIISIIGIVSTLSIIGCAIYLKKKKLMKK